jgi:hypothetical protein
MTYNINNLNVASLDFDDIKTSLIEFLESQSDLSNLDFRNEASSVNLLLNILSTATAYNGVYAQYGFTNSFATTATVLEALLGIAANCSVILAPTKSAVSNRTVNAINGVTLSPYTTFTSRATNGSDEFFFNVEQIDANTSKTIKLYSGLDVVTYTNYNYENQSCEIPYTVNPDTISFYETVINTNVTTEWTRVNKSSTAITGNNTHFTVINGPRGYIVTNNSPSARTITTASKVAIKAITSSGGVGNNAVISPAANTSFGTSELPSGGYDLISVSRAKSSILFKTTGQERCVTADDYKNAILSSGISGTEDRDLITIQNGTYPGSVKIYVENLGSSQQEELIDYLSDKIPVGITIEYSQ